MQPRTQSGNYHSIISRYLILAALATALVVTGLVISARSTSAALPAKGMSSQGAVGIGNGGNAGTGELRVSVPLTGCWTQLTTPNVGSGGNYLFGGDALSAS